MSDYNSWSIVYELWSEGNSSDGNPSDGLRWRLGGAKVIAGLASLAGNSLDELRWRFGGAKVIAVTRGARQLVAELLAVEEAVNVDGGGLADAVDGAELVDGR